MLKKPLAAALLLAAMTSASMAASAWTTASVNFRDGPGTSYYKLGAISACVEVTVGENQNNWYRVQWNGRWGWVAARYLSWDANYCSANYNRRAPAAAPYVAPRRSY
ncbi:SH3 domain-containing protein [Devosia sp. WQ 349]|uniref:SH3 domain-containing protein n=1 Tax=Devosia sp. WQ 349K1 TaxID=2800329 RepID=UPI0019032EAF|nr:SH3 domain-containing protein [Devosia sp. WQ 349K1]MBK1794663.1 SH3 domain-containing protein [Devosia sp. WQ 349K1]